MSEEKSSRIWRDAQKPAARGIAGDNMCICCTSCINCNSLQKIYLNMIQIIVRAQKLCYSMHNHCVSFPPLSVNGHGHRTLKCCNTMTDLLTTKDLQGILNVDRTTIYRMAESGRLPAVKVGGQWRFPRQQLEGWLHQRMAAPAAQPAPVFPVDSPALELFPLECVQLIQDSFADALGVMVLATDLEGQSITQPSNPCGLFTAVESSPVARQRCVEQWARIASEPSIAPRFVESHLGLLCARGLVRAGSEIKAMLVVGGIAPQHWPPDQQHIDQIAVELELAPDMVRAHIDEVHRLDLPDQARVLTFVQRIADIFSHIAQERLELAGRLQRIAEISRI